MIDVSNIKKLIVTFMCAFFMFFTSSNLAFAEAQDQQGDEIMKATETALNYITIDKARVYFNYDKALKNNEPALVLEQGKLIEDVSDAYNESTDRGIKFPVHGRYCGIGHSGPGKPIDVLDAGCQQHDKCFKGMSYKKNCKCNKRLVNYINRNYKKMKGKKQKSKAMAIKAYFSTLGLIGC